MKKTLSTFITEAIIREFENDDFIEAVAEYAIENELTEEEIEQFMMNEFFGVGASVARLRAKAAHPFKLAHAAIKGAAERVKEKVGSAVGAIRQKSQSMDVAARKKLNLQQQSQARQVKKVYTKASGKGGPATKPKTSTGPANGKAKVAKPVAQKTGTLAKKKATPTAKPRTSVLKSKGATTAPKRSVVKVNPEIK